MKKEKIKLFLDMDDTILKSSEAIINMLNKRYNLNKTYDDLTDWKYCSIYPQSSTNLVIEMYDSEEFFNTVEIEPEFKKFYDQYKDKFEFYFVTKGHLKNLMLKQKFINVNFPEATLLPLILKGKESPSFSKSDVNMNFGIQVDDRTDCLLGTNANCKILYTHGKKLPWNRVEPNEDNFYVTSNWQEITDIINTIDLNRFMMEKIY